MLAAFQCTPLNVASCKELKCVFLKAVPFALLNTAMWQYSLTFWHSSNHHIKTAVTNMRWIICQLLVKQGMSVFTDKVSDRTFKRHACAPTLPSCLPHLTELLAIILWATVVALYSVLALHLLGRMTVMLMIMKLQ